MANHYSDRDKVGFSAEMTTAVYIYADERRALLAELAGMRRALIRERELLRRQAEQSEQEKNAEISTLRVSLAERDRTIHALYTSNSWRITWIYRFIGHGLIISANSVKLLCSSPRQFCEILLHATAKFIRESPALRDVAHLCLSFFPVDIRNKLSMAAPPTAQQAGHIGSSAVMPGLGGDWQWLYDEIRTERPQGKKS